MDAMSAAPRRNFHLPLPEDTYHSLRDEAAPLGPPATRAAREARGERGDRRLCREGRRHAHRSRSRAGTVGGRAPAQDGKTPLRRGEVHWAKLEPRSGSEQSGMRPVIVVSNDGFNLTEGWMSVIVVPVSTSPSQAARGPTAVPLSEGAAGLKKASVALCHQVTTLDRRKLVERIGRLSDGQLLLVAEGLKAAMEIE